MAAEDGESFMLLLASNVTRDEVTAVLENLTASEDQEPSKFSPTRARCFARCRLMRDFR